MTARLSDAEIAHYRSEGYVKGIRVLESTELDEVREKYLEFTATLRAQGLTHHQVNGWWAVNRYYFSVCRTPAILNRVESLIGSDMMIWGGQFFTKDPHDGSTVPWHQDAYYWHMTPHDRIVSVWVALWDVDAGNGAMQVIPGSHRNILPHEGRKRPSDVLAQVASPGSFDPSRAVNLSLRAGEMSLHAPGLLHGSPPNRSERPRCGMTMRISSPEVEVDRGEIANFRWILLRGRCRRSNIPTLSPPAEDRVPTGYNQFGADDD